MTTSTAYLCPCGDTHAVSAKVAKLIDELGRNQLVTTPSGSWYVPRVWIAVHGLAAIELPFLARRYNWPTA